MESEHTFPSVDNVGADHRFPVVGLGASAGGLAALRKYFEGMPEKCGMAFVVVVHLDPTQKSHMAELLQTSTQMRVRQVTRALKVEADNVYVIPPDKDLTLKDGHFQLAPRAVPKRSRAPIDGFFRTLAEVHSTDAVGIVLSGTGSDGTQGLKWIKERGGITMAQSPDEAEYSSMPMTAIETGYVDVVLPVGLLGAETLRLCSGDLLDDLAPDGHDHDRDKTVHDILTLIRSKTDHDFNVYKRSTIDRRLARRAHFARLPDLPAYLEHLRENDNEVGILYDDLLIAVTSFFRDPEAFEALEATVIPGLFAKKDATENVRVWVSGCATGEEAYSTAILLCEYADRLPNPPQIQIFATDVHERGFAFAREGMYPESIAADVSAERLARFFVHESSGFRIKPTIREKVIFASHNLLRDPPFLRIDLINCRNLLIYLQRDAQRKVLQLFHFALRPGGSLFLGTSESVDDVSKMFTVLDKKHRIFKSVEAHRANLSALVEWRPDGARADAGRKASDVFAGNAPIAQVHRQLLEAYAPPSLLVNKAGEIVHLSERAGQYLRHGGGEPSQRLADLLPAAAGIKVRKLILQIFATNEKATLRGIQITIGGEKRKVDLIARPFAGTHAAEPFALIVFEESRAAKGKTAFTKEMAERGNSSTPAGRRLERELSEVRGQLLTSVEEYEGAIEELKGSNEELQSINEEQRATEEELEASKEELQSINEELHTINQEFRNKIEELAELNSDLVNIIESTGIPTIFLDRGLLVRRFTPSATALFKLLPTDAGRPLADLAHALDYPALIDDAKEVMRTLVRSDREISTVDGRWYLARLSPYRSAEDRIGGVVISLLETTDRKAGEIEREKLLNEVQATSLAKSNFIGVMSHELRTPLNAIIGYADILTAGAVGKVSVDQIFHLERIKASAMHLAHMIDDSLQSVRIESGIATLTNEPLDVGAIVREVAAVTEPLVSAKQLEFKVNVEEGNPIVADGTRIRQILFNILGNAIRYTDTGTVSISSKVTEHGATITIEDTGIGISAENLERIFERFWQVDQSKTRLRGGTGLGLMVSRSLARLMGGELEVSSELGRGSRFIIRIPSGPPHP